jgi:hypothetical protein
MRPLVADMVQDDASKRPTIDDVVTRFNAIRKKLGIMKLRSRLHHEDDTFGLFRDFAHIFKSIRYSFQGVPAIPTR